MRHRSRDVTPIPQIGEWKCSEEIGRGSFSTVWKATSTRTQQSAAVKVIPTADMSVKLKECLQREIHTLFKIRHKNVVELYDSVETPDKVYLITEFCCGGELRHWNKSIDHSDQEKLSIFKQLVQGITHLHEMHLVHRDIKPHNVLLNDEDQIKIADFGFVCQIEPDSLAETLCGSPLYMAPEILLQKGYDSGVDVWSLGVLAYEMFSGHPPFAGANSQDLLRRIKRDWQSLSFRRVPGPVTDLLKEMLVPDPKHRLTSSRLSRHPLFVDLFQSTLPLSHPGMTIESLIFDLSLDTDISPNLSQESDSRSVASSYTRERDLSETAAESFVLVTSPTQHSFFQAKRRERPVSSSLAQFSSLLGSSPRLIWKSWAQFFK